MFRPLGGMADAVGLKPAAFGHPGSSPGGVTFWRLMFLHLIVLLVVLFIFFGTIKMKTKTEEQEDERRDS